MNDGAVAGWIGRPLGVRALRALVPAAVVALAAGPTPAGDANAPISVQVTSSLARERGLGRILSSASEGDTADTAREVERSLSKRRWLRLASGSPEALVTIERRSRVEASRSKDREGRETTHHRYAASGTMTIGGNELSIQAETTFSQSPDASRDDATHFQTVARQLADQVASRLYQRLDELRPNRPQAGFSHQPKYRFLFKGDGLEVTDVEPGSPAERAGLQAKDRIRSIDGEKGTDEMDARVWSWWTEPLGTRVKVEVERQKKRQTVELTLLPARQWAGSRPADPAEPPKKAADAPPAAPAPVSEARPSSRSDQASVELKPGMSQAQVLRALGEPQKKVAFGSKEIWTYEGLTVTFVDGRVSDVR